MSSKTHTRNKHALHVDRDSRRKSNAHGDTGDACNTVRIGRRQDLSFTGRQVMIRGRRPRSALRFPLFSFESPHKSLLNPIHQAQTGWRNPSTAPYQRALGVLLNKGCIKSWANKCPSQLGNDSIKLDYIRSNGFKLLDVDYWYDRRASSRLGATRSGKGGRLALVP